MVLGTDKVRLSEPRIKERFAYKSFVSVPFCDLSPHKRAISLFEMDVCSVAGKIVGYHM